MTSRFYFSQVTLGEWREPWCAFDLCCADAVNRVKSCECRRRRGCARGYLLVTRHVCFALRLRIKEGEEPHPLILMCILYITNESFTINNWAFQRVYFVRPCRNIYVTPELTCTDIIISFPNNKVLHASTVHQYRGKSARVRARNPNYCATSNVQGTERRGDARTELVELATINPINSNTSPSEFVRGVTAV